MVSSRNSVVNTTDTVLDMGFAALFMATPAGIEASERAGQTQLVNSDVLPTENRNKAVCEAWGIQYGEPVKGDPLFVNVTLPAGWTKRATAHYMHNDLVDDKGHKRGGVFYKADFWDRAADMHVCRRLEYSTSYEKDDSTYGLVRTSDGSVVFSTDTVALAKWDDCPKEQKAAQKFVAEREALRDGVLMQAKQWLMDNYPDYESYGAYWDLDVENGEKPASV